METVPSHNILVIDDSEAEVRLVMEAAKISGLQDIAELFASFSTEEGWDFLEKRIEEAKHLDVIFLDLNVPMIGGIELLKKIKADKRFAHIPVFILTNSDHREDMLACSTNGADAYFQKPSNFVRFIDFFGAVKESLERDKRVSVPFIQQQFAELKRA